MNFQKGDSLKIEPHTSKKGKGLTYSAMTVVVAEDGCTGGWDVYDGTSEGQEVSFYGFSVTEIVLGGG